MFHEVWSWSVLGTQHAEVPFFLVNTGLPWSYVLSSVGNILYLDLDKPIVPTPPESPLRGIAVESRILMSAQIYRFPSSLQS